MLRACHSSDASAGVVVAALVVTGRLLQVSLATVAIPPALLVAVVAMEASAAMVAVAVTAAAEY
ncbi:hypothetical protein [Candidimonas nitroreducens]|uniref:hypothetical protein n=1 Tax=Candidimonas nitroreducens TaxID=683354 RepID=UPI001302F253|nr:hypothetical protein [Candidimonas nitroreducens]